MGKYEKFQLKIELPSAVSRPFRISRCALADGDGIFDVITTKWYARVMERPNFILHVLCHPGLHLHSLTEV
jgi:hypothetical protein